MKIKFVLPLLTIILVNCQIALGQFLHIDTVSVPTYVYENSPVSLVFSVKNTGIAPYNGTIVIYMEELSYNFPKDIYAGSHVIGINDSVIINANDVEFQSLYFQYGNNIVVVWPKGMGVSNDSLYFNMYMDYNLAVTNYEAYEFNIYPNPFSDKIKVEWNNPKNSIEQVRIYNLYGTLLKNCNMREEFIYLSELNSGIYLMELQLNDGSTITKKLNKL
jgi:hypothetical protein